MKLFSCDGCGQLVYFENTRCLSCGRRLAYDPNRRQMTALDEVDGRLVPAVGGDPVFICANTRYDACNWLAAQPEQDAFCRSCRHNRTIPDLTIDRNVELWRRLEASKHRLIDSLIALKLPLPDRTEDPVGGLAFDFLDAAGPAPGDGGRVMTGHADGVITVAVHEADDAVREQIRAELGEPYRSPLGHLRHEAGHFYFDRLVVLDPSVTTTFRALFGDERADYQEALQRHYGGGAPQNWQENHVSAYATAHPWEDFAETFAHYLHIVDTLETAHAFGLAVRPRVPGGEAAATRIDIDPIRSESFDAIIARWLPLTYAVNSLNRSMGQPDLYPFVLPPKVIEKLGFVHDLVHAQARAELAA